MENKYSWQVQERSLRWMDNFLFKIGLGHLKEHSSYEFRQRVLGIWQDDGGKDEH